jgi:hypothetical protein
MPARNKSVWRVRLIVLQAVSWTFLISGLVLVGKSALEITGVRHVTTNSLSWSSAGLLLLLVGSLTNSCSPEFKLGPSNPVDPKVEP